MSAYLFTWNPSRWHWADLQDVVDSVGRGEPVEIRWSCGNTKSIPIGARAFLLRQGVEPRGIMASGWTATPTYQGDHWDADRARSGDTANFVALSVDAILNPELTPPLDPRKFVSDTLRAVYWTTPSSGIRLSNAASLELEHLWSAYTPGGRRDLGMVAPDMSAIEGKSTMRLVIHRSRERALRAAKLQNAADKAADHRLRCEVSGCGFDFETIYGDLGKGYAQVHHLQPLGAANAPVETKLEDLAVVCANCHAMIHRGGVTRTLNRLIRDRKR